MFLYVPLHTGTFYTGDYIQYMQGVTKRCRLFWLANSIPYMSDSLEKKRQNAGGRGLLLAVYNSRMEPS
jgi:hypothetical protein